MSKLCDTCNKSDVCMYKKDVATIVHGIKELTKYNENLIDTSSNCKKWGAGQSNTKGLV